VRLLSPKARPHPLVRLLSPKARPHSLVRQSLQHEATSAKGLQK